MSSEIPIGTSYFTERLTLRLVTNSASATFYNVYLKDSDRYIGYVNIIYNIHQICYAIDPLFRGRGYAPEAVAKVLEVTDNKDELYLDIRKTNRASIRVAQKLGFVLSSSDQAYYQFRLPKPQ